MTGLLPDGEVLSRVPGASRHISLNTDGCWVWTGPKIGATGRPAVYLSGCRSRVLPRVLWALRHGRPVPPHCYVMGVCGRRLCVRPSHLRAVPVPDSVSFRKYSHVVPARRSRLVTNRVTNSD